MKTVKAEGFNVKEFKERLKAERDVLGINQNDFAKEMGITWASVNHYENGTILPVADFIIKAARYFNVSSDYLLGISDIRNTFEEDENKQRCLGLLQFTEGAYLRKLMIVDHLRECLQLYDLYKLKISSWEDVQRELADLCILLEDEIGLDLLAKRKIRFREKAGEQNA